MTLCCSGLSSVLLYIKKKKMFLQIYLIFIRLKPKVEKLVAVRDSLDFDNISGINAMLHTAKYDILPLW